MLYGMMTGDWATKNGSVYILQELDGTHYHVLEGNCDAVLKQAITLISKEEYAFIRARHNEVLQQLDTFSEDAKEYFGELYELRNTLNKK